MVGVLIKCIIFDICLDMMFRKIESTLSPIPERKPIVTEDWSIAVGERFKTIVTMSHGVDTIYHNCKIVDNDYANNGWSILITYDNFTGKKMFKWISHGEIYRMIR